MHAALISADTVEADTGRCRCGRRASARGALGPPRRGRLTTPLHGHSREGSSTPGGSGRGRSSCSRPHRCPQLAPPGPFTSQGRRRLAYRVPARDLTAIRRLHRGQGCPNASHPTCAPTAFWPSTPRGTSSCFYRGSTRCVPFGLLAEIGDCRARFPIPESLASLAGVTPVDAQPGRMKTTSFRPWSRTQNHALRVISSPGSP